MPNSGAHIFALAVLTATAKIPKRITQDASELLVQLTMSGFSGTIDFQGKLDDDAGWITLPYVEIAGAGPWESVVAQLSFTTDDDDQAYILPIVMPIMQVVMTRSAGALDAFVWAHKVPSHIEWGGAAPA